ncbi:MAG: hypothetical protein ACT4P6_02100 [Gemmatimonadaceae bacterium]
MRPLSAVTLKRPESSATIGGLLSTETLLYATLAPMESTTVARMTRAGPRCAASVAGTIDVKQARQ